VISDRIEVLRQLVALFSIHTFPTSCIFCAKPQR